MENARAGGPDGPLQELADALARVSLTQAGRFGRHECEPGWEWRPTFDDYDLWFVTKGSGTASCNGSDPLPLSPGSLFVFAPGDRAHLTQDPDDRLTVLYCHFAFEEKATGRPTRLPDHLMPGPHITVRDVGLIADALHRIVRRLREPSPLSTYAASGMLMDLLVQIGLQDAIARGVSIGMDARLQDAIDIILERPARRPELEQVARAVGLSAAQLSRLFVAQTGTTFRRFTVDARLERARDLLRTTVMDVNQIATVLGYSDQFLLSRQFRAKYGVPPSHYRRSVHNSISS